MKKKEHTHSNLQGAAKAVPRECIVVNVYIPQEMSLETYKILLAKSPMLN